MCGVDAGAVNADGGGWGGGDGARHYALSFVEIETPFHIIATYKHVRTAKKNRYVAAINIHISKRALVVKC